MAAGALAPLRALAQQRGAGGELRMSFREPPFKLGVASGEPDPNGFVLWTRLAPDPLNGGGMPPVNVEVDWQVAEDEALTKVVARGSEVAIPDLGHAVHAEVVGLRPDRWYFYRSKPKNQKGAPATQKAPTPVFRLILR